MNTVAVSQPHPICFRNDRAAREVWPERLPFTVRLSCLICWMAAGQLKILVERPKQRAIRRSCPGFNFDYKNVPLAAGLRSFSSIRQLPELPLLL